MEIFINGVKKSLESNLTVYKLVKDLGYENKRVAIELNNEIISRSDYKNKLIVEGDQIEIIKAVGGG
ncbi:sulfur carrier protein ThiS [Gammaproteobacteria bacterium]|jgi:sulfur carrier protein|nr:sulfur carrier protein ThiS [Gammaproteobacteria bacterium]